MSNDRGKYSPTCILNARVPLWKVSYAYVAWKFAFHFLNRDTAEIRSVKEALGGAGSDASVKLVHFAILTKCERWAS